MSLEENASLVPKTTLEQQAVLDSLRKKSGQTQAQIAEENLAGTAQAGAGLLPSQESVQREAGTLGMAQNPMLSEALQRRASSIYDRGQANLKRDITNRAAGERFKRLGEQSAIEREQSDIANQVRDAQYQRYQDEKQRRAGLISSLISAGANVGGSLIGALTGGGAGAGMIPGAGSGK